MKKTFTLLSLFVVITTVIFFLYSSIYPVHAGFCGENAIGYYNFSFSKYEIVDYSGNGSVIEVEKIGGVLDFAKKIILNIDSCQ